VISDKELAVMLQQATVMEQRLSGLIDTEDLAERDSALTVYRLVRPMVRNIHTWMALRALRQQLQGVSAVK